MAAKTVEFELPEGIGTEAARFAMAAGLIFQGGGIITVADAARLAGMERAAFVKAMAALGPEMEEMVEEAEDMERVRRAYEEMKKPGGEPLSLEEAERLLNSGTEI